MTISQERMGLLFILVGPTGAGKNTIMNGVLAKLPDLRQLPTATTRPIRPNEKEGREHHFVTEPEFRRMIANQELLEWQNVHGRLYGVPRGTVEHLIENQLDRIADIDVLGALAVHSMYPDNVILIFVQPGADENVVETIRERLQQRNEPEEEIQRRLRRVEMEMDYAPYCDYLVMNEEIEQSVHVMESIITAERSRRDLMNLRARSDHPRHRLSMTAVGLAVFNGKVLFQDGALPKERVCEGELPQEAAARSLVPVHQTTKGDFRLPLYITLQEHNYHEEMTYWYQFAATHADPLPDGWAWHPLAKADIPPGVLEQVQQTEKAERMEG